ncbi:MAG TPA: AAA family ATPase [Cyclobacteriaceae bacterium]|jgi:predicted ATP-dependent endonuclease of OLD family|nr:AAA family ATPase [Cyclobacteriaceae bacterium]
MGDTSKHLTYFKVENFKRFESFEMNDLGQFNLILGDNNVGKTSVLEALLIDQSGFKFINNLLTVLGYRNLKPKYNYDDLKFFTNQKLSLNQGKNFTRFELITSDGASQQLVLEFDFENQFLKFLGGLPTDVAGYRLFQSADANYNYSVPFLPFYKGHDNDLAVFYAKLQPDRELRRSFIKSLQVLVPTLENVELSISSQRDTYLIMYQDNVNHSLPLAFFGDGTLKLFRFLAEIIINTNKRLMIDEVDAGIHYSRFKDFWKIILKTARDNNVQLFMTTHNEECIKYFKEVLENDLPELKDKSRSITLIENPKSREVKAFTYTFDQLEANIDVGNEIRGGAR